MRSRTSATASVRTSRCRATFRSSCISRGTRGRAEKNERLALARWRGEPGAPDEVKRDRSPAWALHANGRRNVGQIQILDRAFLTLIARPLAASFEAQEVRLRSELTHID